MRRITQRLVWLEIDRLNREPTDEGPSLDDVLARLDHGDCRCGAHIMQRRKFLR